jgi:hypothetical protein
MLAIILTPGNSTERDTSRRTTEEIMRNRIMKIKKREGARSP